MYPSFERSFLSNTKSKYWGSNNGNIKPRDVFKNSHKKYLFDCDKCQHEFESSLNSITNGKCWCGFCGNRQLCDKENCKTCFDKSFASHEKKLFWSNKNEKQPREVFKNTNIKYLFDCLECSHEIEISLNSISSNNRWCCYCSHQKLCEINDCKTCFDNSFSSHPKHIFWSSKNEKQPREVFKSSHSKNLFVCENRHEFEISLYHITNDGCWCPKCQYKTETKLYEKMIPLFPSIISQYKQEWCKNKQYLPFDFCIPEPKIIIELDGIQHFIQVSNWTSPEENFKNDKYKEKCANENGYSIIRIIQEDVLNDKYDWCKELCEAIENIKNGDKVVNIYLCKNNEYDLFM